MTDRPILFNAPMVRAVLAGTKTQTRRPFRAPSWIHADELDDFVAALNKHGGSCAKRGTCDGLRNYTGPFGKNGGTLWVRESFAANVPGCEFQGGYSYRADHLDPLGDGPAQPIKWTPSIHMPRAASRITLAIQSIRVERLQDITDEDAKAEGLGCITKDGKLYKYGIPDRDGLPGTDNDGWPWHEWDKDPRKAFARLWTRIYGPESWNINPLVWVCKFRKVTP
jgi:hypothetical protein